MLTSFFSVFDAKRLIGRKFADPEVQADLKHFPFKVIDKGTKPYVQVTYRGEEKEFVSIFIFDRASELDLIIIHSRPRRCPRWC